jgi:hypothetical protein
MLETILKYTSSARGYEINEQELVITMMFNIVRIPLNEISFIQFPKDITKGLKRLNHKNNFSCDEVGEFKAYLTKWENIILLKLGSETLAISPDNPDEFLDRLKYKL